MSYLLFDAAYTRELIDIGYRDCDARIDEIEDLIATSPPLRTLVLPAHTQFDREQNERWIAALSDLVPPTAWRSGPADLAGEAMYRVARFPPRTFLEQRLGGE